LRLGGNLNVSVAGVDGVALLSGLQPVVAVSSGSACSSAKIAQSHVLRALGGSLDLTHVSIRFGIGKYNTEEEINIVAAHFISTVHSLRKQSNLV
jgi:cysteine desulfurase